MKYRGIEAEDEEGYPMMEHWPEWRSFVEEATAESETNKVR